VRKTEKESAENDINGEIKDLDVKVIGRGENMALYWCMRCGCYHQSNSAVGRAHRKYSAGVIKSRRRYWF